MLRKVIDLGSIPMGQFKTTKELVKGRAVKVDFAKGTIEYATKDDEVFGFCTYRIEDSHGGDLDRDTIKANSYCVVYTLVKNNMWNTTECKAINELKAGDTLKVGAEGKLEKDSTNAGKFVVYETGMMGSTPTVTFLIK